MAKIVVTGAGGQLGCELRRIAGDGSREWVFTDVGELDIADAEQVAACFRAERPDAVVNCAAWTDVDGAETNRDAAFRVNARGPAVIADAARDSGAVFIHVSTDFVFSGSGTRPYTEDDEPRPLNVYGESKLAGERAVQDSGCRGAVVRTSWLYSPYGRNFVKSIMGAASKHAAIRVVDDQWGSPTAADGLARAIAAMIPGLMETGGQAGLFHYCDTGVVNRSGFAEEIIRLGGIDCRVEPVASAEYPMAAARPAYSALDTSKITRVFGIAPRTWQQALAECVAEIVKNY